MLSMDHSESYVSHLYSEQMKMQPKSSKKHQQPQTLLQRIQQLLNSIILFAIALILSAVLLPLGIIVTLVLAVVRLDSNKLLVYLTKILYVSAEAIDLVANVVCRDLFNRTLRDQE